MKNTATLEVAKPVAPVLSRTGRIVGVNVFRDAWEYRITECGAERLATRKGASPAFLSILAIAATAPVTFAHVARQMRHIACNDLELWLSAMCSMGLLAPVASASPVTSDATADVKAAPQPEQPAVAPPALAAALLVHADAKVRGNWRRALGGRGFQLIEAASLDAVERLIRERRPTWVVLGLEGEDFDGLHLLRALKRPRAPRISRVCLVLPRGTDLDYEACETVARADATAASVPDIVRALCGETALDEPAPTDGASRSESAEHPATALVAPALVAAEPETTERPVLARQPARPPANAPAWMSLLYGRAYEYGSFETDLPSELEVRYPRLMVRMIEGWGQPAFGEEINGLIVDERGDRKGFPPEVMEELWFLSQLHMACHASGPASLVANADRGIPRALPRPQDRMLMTSSMVEWTTSNSGA